MKIIKTTYFIWKSHKCKECDRELQEISGKDFLALVRSSVSKGRYFIKLPSTEINGSDGVIVIETNRDEYRNWKREKNHDDYIRNTGRDILVESYHALTSEEDKYYGESMFSDSGDFDDQCNELIDLADALNSLSIDEYKLIEYFYLSGEQRTIRSYEEKTKVPKSSVNRKLKAVLQKLNKFLD